jgi:Glycosyltransferases involved in cell wall biogenesis
MPQNLISFIIPTLNRKRLAVRAVQSCLDAALPPGFEVQVVVSDCGSTDGSWEELQEAYASDPRVQLLAGRKGAGPIENWLNAARKAEGEFITFVWSDDFIADHFVQTLLPTLLSGQMLAVGHGLQRDVENCSALPFKGGLAQVGLGDFLRGYFSDRISRPVSPTCSFFARKPFQLWLDAVESWSKENALREEVLWRRAIGPDLFLYLLALRENAGAVTVHEADTAQFSWHPGSISVSSSALPMLTGYWLAVAWSLTDPGMAGRLSLAEFARALGRMSLYGRVLSWLDSGPSATPGIRAGQADFKTELGKLHMAAKRHKLRYRLLLGYIAALPFAAEVALRYGKLNRYRKALRAQRGARLASL